jgi:hypothetical protein
MSEAVFVLMGAFAMAVWTQRDRLVGHGPFVTKGVLLYFVWAAGLASLLGGVTVVLRLA